MPEPMPEFPQYPVVSDLLSAHEFETTASEIHGVIAGVNCLPESGRVDWLELVAPVGSAPVPELSPELSRALLDLSHTTKEQIERKDFVFSLFLPNQDASVRDRTDALAAWCRGFLLGISATGLTAENCSDVTREILSDIVELSRVEAESGESAEEERALLEIEEYLRVAVQLLNDELSVTSEGEAN